MRFVNLAWRNVHRNRRRTLLTLLATIAGVLALSLSAAFFDGNGLQMVRNTSSIYSGHMQIHRRGYDADPSLDLRFHANELAALRLHKLPGVVAITPRLSGRALLSSDMNSRGIMLIGIDPELETTVTTLHQRLSSGQALEKGRKGDILIGSPLAKALNLVVGDTVAITTEGVGGSFGSARYRLAGIFDTQNISADSVQAFITLADADDLFAAEGALTTIVVKLVDHDMSITLAAKLAAQLGTHFEVLDWKQLLPAAAQYIAFHSALINLLMIVLFSIVALGVANTIWMSVIERVREFGVMMAIGTSPFQIFRVVIYEGLLINLLGLAIGLSIAYCIISYLSHVGIKLGTSVQSMSAMQSQGMGGDTIYPYFDWHRVLTLVTVVLVVTLLATLYPAWKSARMIPLQAMQGLTSARRKRVKFHSERAANGRFLLLALAFRNLGRHPLRSALAIFSAILGMASLVFLICFGAGYFSQLVENSTGLITGDAQIQHKNFRSQVDLHLALKDGNKLLRDLKEIPEILAASPRIETTATASTALQAEPMVLMGVDPVHEPQVTFLARSIKQGRYLTAGEDRELVIGKKMAGLLGVNIGEKVVLTVLDYSGNLQYEAVRVVGIFSTGNHGPDGSLGYITLNGAQKILGMGHKVTSIALRVRDRQHQDIALQKARTSITEPDERIYGWEALLPNLAQINQVTKSGALIVLGVVTTMVAVLVMNTILMSVLERTREFGVMLAIGSPPRLIVQLVCLEALVIGVSGTLLGLVVGCLLVWMHLNKGVNLITHGGTAVDGVTNIIYPKIEIALNLRAAIILPILVLIASLYPAFRASRLEPVKAVRHA